MHCLGECVQPMRPIEGKNAKARARRDQHRRLAHGRLPDSRGPADRRGEPLRIAKWSSKSQWSGFDFRCPRAASAADLTFLSVLTRVLHSNVKSKSGTRIIDLLVSLWF